MNRTEFMQARERQRTLAAKHVANYEYRRNEEVLRNGLSIPWQYTVGVLRDSTKNPGRKTGGS